jgi:sialate O-acetylesterase
VAYHFARQVQAATGVPVGLVNLSWGGTHLETWFSPRAAQADTDLAPLVQALPADNEAFAAAARLRADALAQRWQGSLPLQVPPSPTAWADTALDDRDWPRLQAPKVWEEQGLPGFDGTVWLRRHVSLSAAQAAAPAVLELGMVDDCDETWVNGQRVGRLCGWDIPRRYPVPADRLRAGDNVVAVRVLDTGGGGGFHGRAQDMQLRTAAGDVPLAGEWMARVESSLRKDAPTANDAPTLAFNGMVNPLQGLPLRGVLWYQGESNVGRAARYGPALRRFIADWRRHFGQPELPFLYVQLAAFLPLERNTLAGSAWAELREAQRQALALPHTGMAVTTDVGDADDIHPRNKRAVGERLALLALRDVYQQPATVASGPRLLSAQPVQVAGTARMELRFADAQGGLLARGGGALQGFAVADASRRFVPAQAQVQGTRVLVWAAGVKRPVAVRYGWVDNPSQANLVNGAGLPASPFRSDNWPLLTEGVVFAP